MALIDHWVTIGHSTLPTAHLVLWKMRISLEARELRFGHLRDSLRERSRAVCFSDSRILFLLSSSLYPGKALQGEDFPA